MLAFHFRQKTYLIKFRLGFTLMCLFLLSLCIVLGVWQVHRYLYKKTLLTTYQQRLTDAPKDFEKQVGASDLQFESVKTTGYYINPFTILIQNRFYHDALGFEVLTRRRGASSTLSPSQILAEMRGD